MLIFLASAHLEISDEEDTAIKKEPQEISSSAKCILLSKRQPKLLGTWGRPKVCRIPRPPNAFMIFANDWRRKLALKYPGLSNLLLGLLVFILIQKCHATREYTHILYINQNIILKY